MRQNLHVRIFQSRQNAFGHFRAALIHVGMHRRDHHVQLRQNFVVHIQLAIFQNVDFAAGEDSNSQILGVSGLDHFNLLERTLFIEPVGDGDRFAVIGQRNIFVTEIFRC